LLLGFSILLARPAEIVDAVGIFVFREIDRPTVRFFCLGALKALRTILPIIYGSLISTLYLEIIDSSLVVYYGFPASAQVNFTKAIDDNRQFPDDFSRFFGSRFDRDKKAPAPAFGVI
jgi:hypothetical protein